MAFPHAYMVCVRGKVRQDGREHLLLLDLRRRDGLERPAPQALVLHPLPHRRTLRRLHELHLFASVWLVFDGTEHHAMALEAHQVARLQVAQNKHPAALHLLQRVVRHKAAGDGPGLILAHINFFTVQFVCRFVTPNFCNLSHSKINFCNVWLISSWSILFLGTLFVLVFLFRLWCLFFFVRLFCRFRVAFSFPAPFTCRRFRRIWVLPWL
mmetsp:Transcript_7534/g.11439  ORF Transcript_7534/g.11439 Transcript_7534/m.11439 type:complete len:211 (-) Transcript_7534:104-736(-)